MKKHVAWNVFVKQRSAVNAVDTHRNSLWMKNWCLSNQSTGTKIAPDPSLHLSACTDWAVPGLPVLTRLCEPLRTAEQQEPSTDDRIELSCHFLLSESARLQSGLRVGRFGATPNAGWCLKNAAAAADVRCCALMDR